MIPRRFVLLAVAPAGCASADGLENTGLQAEKFGGQGVLPFEHAVAMGAPWRSSQRVTANNPGDPWTLLRGLSGDAAFWMGRMM